MSLRIYTSITKTRRLAWIMRAAREGFMSVWYTCDGRFMTFPEGPYLRSSLTQCPPFQVLLYLWISAHPAAQSFSTWERNLGIKTHQVITGTTTTNYHHLCLPQMHLCLGASQLSHLQAGLGWATAEQQDHKHVRLWPEIFFSISVNRDNALPLGDHLQ